MGAVRDDISGIAEPVAWPVQHLYQDPGGGVDLGHRLSFAVGHPEVGAVRSESDGIAEPVAWPAQHLDQGPGGGVDFGHPVVRMGKVAVEYPDVGAVRGDINGIVESVARAREFGYEGPCRSVELKHRVIADHPKAGAVQSVHSGTRASPTGQVDTARADRARGGVTAIVVPLGPGPQAGVRPARGGPPTGGTGQTGSGDGDAFTAAALPEPGVGDHAVRWLLDVLRYEALDVGEWQPAGRAVPP